MADPSDGMPYYVDDPIGNVGRRLFRRRNRRQEAHDSLERWLALVPAPHIPPTPKKRSSVDDNVIDATWRIISDEEESTND